MESSFNIADYSSYVDLQCLLDTNPEMFMDNLSVINPKFPAYMICVKFPEDVILKYAKNGLDPKTLLICQNLAGYVQYYVRTLAYGVEAVDEMYSDPSALALNQERIDFYNSVSYDDPGYEAHIFQLTEVKFMY